MTAADPTLARRLRAQLLSGPPVRTVEAVVERLLAVQAQDLHGARLTVRARSTGLSASVIDRALAERRLVVTWVNRGTLHLVRAEDYRWLHALTTPQLASGNARRLRQEEVSPAQAERGVEILEDELSAGPRTRTALRAALSAGGVPVAGQAVPHLLFLATLRGLCVRGPMVGREQAFVLVRDWLPTHGPVDEQAALAELGRRYAASHAPATAEDLSKWAGITLTAARTAMAAVTGQLPPAPPPPGPLLLGPFDELLMGWASRDLVLGGAAGVITSNGVFRPVILVDGRAVGTWSRAGHRVSLHPFLPLDPAVRRGLQPEVDDVERFLST